MEGKHLTNGENCWESNVIDTHVIVYRLSSDTALLTPKTVCSQALQVCKKCIELGSVHYFNLPATLPSISNSDW